MSSAPAEGMERAPGDLPGALAAIAHGDAAVVVSWSAGERRAHLVAAASSIDSVAAGVLLRSATGAVTVARPAPRGRRPRREEAWTGRTAATLALAIRTAARGGAREGAWSDSAVLTVEADPDGVLGRADVPEACCDLVQLACAGEAAVFAEVLSGDRARAAEPHRLQELAAKHGLPVVTILDVVRRRLLAERRLRAETNVRLPTRMGTFECFAWLDVLTGIEQLALVRARGSAAPALVALHEQCFAGHVLRSRACGCRDALTSSLAALDAWPGGGFVAHLRASREAAAPARCAVASRPSDVQDDAADAAGCVRAAFAAQMAADVGIAPPVTTSGDARERRELRRFGLELAGKSAAAGVA